MQVDKEPLEPESQRLRKLIKFYRQEVQTLSLEAKPLRDELQRLTAAINHGLVAIYRAELKLARLDERVKVVPASASGRLLTEAQKLAKMLKELPDEKREKILELLGVCSKADNDDEDEEETDRVE